MMDLAILPPLNAGLNFVSALLLVLGFVFIKQRAITAHTMCMLGACGSSALFLISYLYYHFHHGATPFPGQGWTRPVYFTILISHMILAVTIIPLVIRTLYFAFTSKFYQHAGIAKKTLPIWLYVSITGVVIYWILYRIHGVQA